jgi:hypothetical protein
LATAGDKIRKESLVELKSLTGWFDLMYGTTIIVIGGWAVFSYNPHLGSFDIDCIGPRDPFYAQLDLYMASHGYELVKRDQIGLTKFFVKRVLEENSYIGDIHIDACSFEDENCFKEDNTKRLPYGLCAKTEYVNRREINGSSIWVPKKELLFLYKLKALRDRSWVLANEQLDAEEKNYFQGKIDKDKMDLLALLDPRHGPLNPVGIFDIINKFDLIFATDTIKNLPNEQDTIQKYGEKRQEVDVWVGRIREGLGI